MVIIFSSGCSGLLEEKSKNEPTYRILITPAFYPIWESHQEAFHKCITNNKRAVRVIYEMAYANQVKLTPNDLLLSLFDPSSEGKKIYHIGTVNLKFMVHNANPQYAINSEELRDLYRGKITSWQALTNGDNMKSHLNGDIHLYLYPPYDEITLVILKDLQITEPITGIARIVYNQKDVLEALKLDENGLGIVVENEGLMENIHSIEIQGNKEQFISPLLAQISNNTDNIIIQWIGCFQKVLLP